MKKLFFIFMLGAFSATSVYAQKEKSASLEKVDQIPEFPGGMNALFEFVGTNLKYPKVARDKKIEGKVLVKLVVEEDGSIGETTIMKGLGHGCDEEVTRVVNAMPKWIPGRKDNETVRASLILPVVFALGEKTSK